jgi:hypothetical protein
VDLVEEEDRALPLHPEPLARTREDLPNVFDRRGHGGELLELRAGRPGDDPRERRLPGAGRAVEDRRGHPVLLDRKP